MALDDIAVDLGGVAGGELVAPMPACRFSAASVLASAAFTFTVKPLASRCLTQAPQHSQVADFHTSIEAAVSAALPGATPKTIRDNRSRMRIVMVQSSRTSAWTP
jgi:hypothetical protein